MKYYLYVSTTKVEMLYAQIPSPTLKTIAGELKINLGVLSGTLKTKEGSENLYSKTRVVSTYLAKNDQVGSIPFPKSYIADNLTFKWGILKDGRTSLSFFGGVRNNTTLVLIGSSASLVGEDSNSDSNKNQSHSLNFYRVGFIEWFQSAGETAEPERYIERFKKASTL